MTVNDNKELVCVDKTYTYFAFISYKRENSGAALWLQKNLQSYTLSDILLEKYDNIQQRCSPVFLDRSHLLPGVLENSVSSEVQDSKFLIVICSRAAHENPKYLDMEIQQFIEGGGDVSSIIPFIIDDSRTPEKDCFPSKLQEICQEKNIVGVNIHEAGRHQAFLKVLAKLHGLKVEEIESSDRQRKKANLIRASVAALIFVIASLILGYNLWDYYVPKKEYYIDYTEEYGVPVGIGKISENEMRSINSHYTIISTKGKVRELRHENSYGKLIAHNNTRYKDRPTWAKYTYADDTNNIETTTYYDANEKPVLFMKYGKSLKYIDLKDYEDENNGYRGDYYLNAHV